MPIRSIFALCGAVVLLALAGLSLRWGVGHGLLEPWMIEASRAALQGRWLDADTVASGRANIARAIGLHERADARELYAHYSVAAARLSNGSNAELRMAKQEFEAAIALRPSMPYSWAHLAMTKYRLGEVDAQFYQALNSAMKLGPWEAQVQSITADIGLAVLDEASPSTRDAILAHVARGAVHQADLILSLARKRGKLDTVCSLALPERARKACSAKPGSELGK